MNKYPTDLRNALKRLAASDTPQKRKNARKGLRLLLERIKRDVEKEYPLIDKKTGEPVKKTSVICPACGAPMRDLAALVDHAVKRHGMEPNSGQLVCWCGASFQWYHGKHGTYSRGPREQRRSMIRHLASVKDLKAHVLLGTLKNTP